MISVSLIDKKLDFFRRRRLQNLEFLWVGLRQCCQDLWFRKLFG